MSLISVVCFALSLIFEYIDIFLYIMA